MKTICTICILICIGAALQLVGAVDNGPTVKLAAGTVRGLHQEVSGKKIHFFQGIQYGVAKRFEKPTSAPSWTGVYNATAYRDACPQVGISKPPPGVPAFQTSTMSENCLYANVWTPEGAKNKSVMVFIHGGGFTVGTIFNFLVDGRYLAAKGDLLVVAISYRIGAFGYLYGGTPSTPGNLGYHDQIFALKWVQANIAAFGGDSSKVTIFGESAGSYSVGELILSPLAKGLFHRAILQSGAPNSLTGGMPKSRSLENTRALAKHLNCSTASNQAMVKCLQSKPLLAIVNYTAIEYNSTDRFFTPIYGDEVAPVAPVEALKLGRIANPNVDLLFGVCNDEGTMFALNMFPEYASNATHLTVDSVKRDIIHGTVVYKQHFGAEVADYYTRDMVNATQNELKLATARSFGDLHIVCPTILFGEQLARHSSSSSSSINSSSPKATFFSYRLMQHLGIPGLPYQPWMGVQHTDDLMYLFAASLATKPEDRQLSETMLGAWTSFANTGRPAVTGWEEAFSGSQEGPKITSHFALKTTGAGMVKGAYQALCDGFWKAKIVQ